jgi:Flp pilus assembly protein TadG
MFISLALSFKRLKRCRRGAATVDFMVLLAGVILLFFFVIDLIYTGSAALVTEVTETLLTHAATIYD